MPFIEAASDRDVAVALGAVHAHLRLAQIEVMRRIAQGRLAEVVGPAAIELDHALRLIDVARAAPAIEAAMPPETQEWLAGFADGLNAYCRASPARPYELAILGVDPEPWTVRDLIGVGRLAAMDFTWRVWLRLMRLRQRPDWLRLWQRLVGSGALPVPSFAGASGANALDAVSAAFARGSNSLAVSGARTVSGSPVIASDPHLGIGLPNLWLIAGYRSPGFHVVGLMIPGIPAVALGRNPWIAWGGTSLHAASSDLFDVSAVPHDRIRTRRVRIRARWSREEEVELRESPFGPVVSDAILLGAEGGPPLALKWMGHRTSDELTALLAVNRSRTWEAFVAALEGFAIPSQNMIYADATGCIGQAMAAQVPRRPASIPEDMVLPPAAHVHWERFAGARELPHFTNPPSGFVASANNAPEPRDVPVGFFFSPDERIRRLRMLLTGNGSVSHADLRAIHVDVTMPSAERLRDALLVRLAPATDPDRLARSPIVEALRGWDGSYAEDSRGALAFELMAYHLVAGLHGKEELALYAATWDAWTLLCQDLEESDLIAAGKAAAEALAPAEAAFEKLGTWGNAHRLQIMHPLGRLPLVGRWFRFADLPVGGGNETLMKTAFGFSGGRHVVRFGANARHISDLADVDENYFVLLGGQDGWLGSTTYVDQLSLWRNGTMIRTPLRPESVREAFPVAMEIGATDTDPGPDADSGTHD